jgi:ribosome maturation factor RimP
MISASFWNLVEESAAVHGAHLIDLVVRGEKGISIVEAFVDAEVPVTSDLCAQLSRDFGGIIERNNFVRGSYRLVVSSPGIDRPMKYRWQYRKHIGRPFEMRVREGDTARTIVGRLAEVNEVGVVIEMETMQAQVNMDFENIIEARVKAPW